ncbi:MAG: metallophosphoesterase [Candidatus Methanoperedens sp.]|nr:metallophosphoesterase [Candidatus Methanoperedens sp.]
MAYIVVSDVHLGSEKCNQVEFCNFLDWVHRLDSQPNIIKCKDDKEITIKKPEKIVLLGDILELWDPEDGNRDYVIRDGMKPFSILSHINCEKIYVVGNHDDSLSELEDDIDYVILPNGTKFNICDRHYPEKDEKTGIANGEMIGKQSYFFLHGHQFDKEQDILKKVSDSIGEKWDPLGWFQDMFNISSTKKHWVRNFVIFLALFGGWYYWDKYQSIPLIVNLLHILLFSALMLLLVFGVRYIWNYFMPSSSLNNLILAPLIIVGVSLSGWYFWNNLPSPFRYNLILAALTGFFALSSIPGVVAKSQRLIYNMTKPIDKTAEQIIKEKYYQEKNTIKAEVVVFGHTHFASYYGPNKDTGNRLFINSGNWTGKDSVINGKQRYVNTFVYIDEDGAYLLTWRGCDRIECIEAFPEGKSVVIEPTI